jgi:adenylate cyclase class 2
LEVEIKLAIKDPERARKKLEEVGKFLGKSVEEDTYFNFDCEGGCCRDFAKTDEAVRVRRKDNKCFLTYKGPKVLVEGVKAREEVEFEVGDCEKAFEFLKKMCLKPVITIRKEREYWEVNGATVTLDRVEGLGWFAEVEAFGEGASERVRRLASELFPDAKPVEKTYLEMVMAKRGGTPK